MPDFNDSKQVENQIVNSPMSKSRQIGLSTNSSEDCFKLDEELSENFLPQIHYADTPQEEDVDLLNIDFESEQSDNDEAYKEGVNSGMRRFTIGSPAGHRTQNKGISIEKSPAQAPIAASVPIDITLPNKQTSPYEIEGEEDVIEINKLETKLNKAGANMEEIAEAFSLREQTMFRNMQLLSLSVQPDDCPERLFNIREVASSQENEQTKPASRTYASGAINISSHQPQQPQNSPASIHTPRQPPQVVRPPTQSKTRVKDGRLPNAPQM